MSTREAALRFLYRELKQAKIALGHAETRPGVKPDEINNLKQKIAAVDWLIPLAIKGENNDE